MVIGILLMGILFIYLWAKFGLIWAFVIMIGSSFLLFFISMKLGDMDREKKQKMLEDDNVSEEVKKKIRTELRQEREKEFKQANAIRTSREMKYIGGHEAYSNSRKGNLYLYDDRMDFYTSEIFVDENERNVSLFSIPMREISGIAYDLSENISLSRFIMLGLASFVFKKQTYYLIIKYINRAGIENEVVFETGSIKDQKFFNELNVLRNKSRMNSRNRVVEYNR